MIYDPITPQCNCNALVCGPGSGHEDYCFTVTGMTEDEMERRTEPPPGRPCGAGTFGPDGRYVQCHNDRGHTDPHYSLHPRSAAQVWVWNIEQKRDIA